MNKIAVPQSLHTLNRETQHNITCLYLAFRGSLSLMLHTYVCVNTREQILSVNKKARMPSDVNANVCTYACICVAWESRKELKSRAPTIKVIVPGRVGGACWRDRVRIE